MHMGRVAIKWRSDRNKLTLTCDENPRARDERRVGVGGENVVGDTVAKCGIAGDGDGQVDSESEREGALDDANNALGRGTRVCFSSPRPTMEIPRR